MLSVSQAKELIKQNSKSSCIKAVPLSEAVGKVLAQEIRATIDSPPFHQSAMDGYAFSYEDWDKTSPLLIVGTVQAGTVLSIPFLNNSCIRIFTGAAIPQGLDTVVAQELVKVEQDTVTVLESAIYKGRNVRLKGSQVVTGDLVLLRGHLVNPASVSLVASLGTNSVFVYENPKVHILVTGKELCKPGEELLPGSVYESNSFALKACLQQMGITAITITWVDDNLEQTQKAIENGLSADFLLITGGVSVGDYDYVAQALSKLWCKQIVS
jgi:molybdopterin molybdotransferase